MLHRLRALHQMEQRDTMYTNETNDANISDITDSLSIHATGIKMRGGRLLRGSWAWA